MRLFIAIELPDPIKAKIEKGALLLRAACQRGTFSQKDNYHVTLVFLGEIPPERAQEITAIMDSCVSPPIPLAIGRPGRFRRDGGDVFWRAIGAPASLAALQQNLTQALTAKGFTAEEGKTFTPHLTLARQAVLKEGIAFSALSDTMPEMELTAQNMTLMRSERIDGKLTYTPIHRSDLGG